MGKTLRALGLRQSRVCFNEKMQRTINLSLCFLFVGAVCFSGNLFAFSTKRKKAPICDDVTCLARQIETMPIEEKLLEPFGDIQKLERPGLHVNETSKNCLGNSPFKLNFGVVTYNDYYKVYRSTGLSKKGLQALKQHLQGNGLECPKNIVYLHHNNYEPKMSWKKKLKKAVFRLDGRLYGGNFAYDELEVSKKMHSKLGESDSCNSDSKYFAFRFVHPLAEHPRDRVPYVEAKTNLLESSDKKVVSEAKNSLFMVAKRVLVSDGGINIHCQGGLHRTGKTMLMLRNLQGGTWTKPFRKPIQIQTQMKMKDSNGKEYVKPVTGFIRNLAEKEYYDHNPNDFRQHNLEAIRMLSEDRHFQCLKEKFGCYLNQVPKKLPESIKSCYLFQKPNQKSCTVSPKDFTIDVKRKLFDQCFPTPLKRPEYRSLKDVS